LDMARRGGGAGQNAGGPHIGVLVEGLANGEPQSPKRNVIRNLGVAGGAEQNGVVVPDQIETIFRHHAAVLLVVFAAPIEVIELEREPAVTLGNGVHDLHASRDDFRADTVTGNSCDLVGFHWRALCEKVVIRTALRPGPMLIYYVRF